MTINNDEHKSSEKLRKLAIEKASMTALPQKALSANETVDLLHELRVRQIELEMQNEELKLSQRELELSKQKYFKLYDIAPVGYFSINGSGFVVEANLKACELFGLGRTYLKGQLFSSFIFKDDIDIYYLSVKNLSKTGDSQACELRFIRRNGTILWVLLDISSTQDAGGVISYLIAVSDITERKKFESELAQIRENYEIFFNSINDLLFVLDQNGNILHINNAVSAQLGYLEEELVGKSVLVVHPPERREEAGRIVSEMLAGTAEFCPVPIITKSGRQIPVETRVTPGFWDGKSVIFGVSKDMSEIKKSEEKFSKAFHINSSACGFSDLATGQYIEVNEAFCSLLGFEINEVIGKNAVELGILLPSTLKDLDLKIGNSEKIVNLETELKAKNGDIRHVLLSADNVYIQERKCRFTVVDDITEQERANEKLRKSEERYRIISNQLGERVKELSCLYAVSAIIELPDIPLDEILQKIADSIPTGYQYPDSTCSRITIDGKEYKTDNFKKTNWKQSSNIMEGKIKIGSVDVFYLNEKHFLNEEQDLLRAITQRLGLTVKNKKAEGELIGSNRRQELVNTAGLVGIWNLDLVNNKLSWNDQMFAIYGITRDQFSSVYEAWVSVLHPEDTERGEKEIQMAISGEQEFDTEFRVIWPDGTIHHIKASAQVVRDAAGKPLEMIGTNYDITYQKNSE